MDCREDPYRLEKIAAYEAKAGLPGRVAIGPPAEPANGRRAAVTDTCYRGQFAVFKKDEGGSLLFDVAILLEGVET